jgi:NADH:ubiquinone oxidoreductase subunit E
MEDTKLKEILTKYEGKKGSLIPILQEIQEEFGYLPEGNLQIVSRQTGVRMSQIYGVATFYKQFRLKPLGKYTIRVCHGTACHVSGAQQLSEAIENELSVKDGETTKDNLFTLQSVACLGCCSLAPAMVIGETTYGRCTPDKAARILRKIQEAERN